MIVKTYISDVDPQSCHVRPREQTIVSATTTVETYISDVVSQACHVHPRQQSFIFATIKR